MRETKICIACQRNNLMEATICWYCNSDIRNDYYQQGGSGNDDWISPIVWVVVVILAVLFLATIVTPGALPQNPLASSAEAKQTLKVSRWRWNVKSQRDSDLFFEVENASSSPMPKVYGDVTFKDNQDKPIQTFRFNLKPLPFVPGAKYSYRKNFHSDANLTEPELKFHDQKGEIVSFTLDDTPPEPSSSSKQ